MIRIRPYTRQDLPFLHAINQKAVPAVSTELLSTLAKWISLSECFVAAAEDGPPLGFLTLVPPGTLDYPSLNLRWFEARGGNLNYVDRIAIAPEARGQGIGEKLYAAAFDVCRGRYDAIGCEINRLPSNPGSLAFHKRLGFEEVGSRAFVPGEKEVIYLEKRL